MAKVELNAFSFNGGELSPEMHGRSDLEKYASAMALMKNMVARPHGGGYRRVGTHCIDFALENDKPERMIPFRFSVVQSYMLEFGDFRMRVIMDDALVAYPEGDPNEGQPVIIETPYSANDLDQLRVTQKADLMILTHHKYPIYKLHRENHHVWVFQQVTFGEMPVKAPTGLHALTDGNNGAAYCVSARKSASEESLPSNVFVCNQGRPINIPDDVDSLNIQQCREVWVVWYGEAWPASWDVWNMNAEQVRSFLRSSMGYNIYEFWDNGTLKWNGTRPDGTKFWYYPDDLGAWRNEGINGMNYGWGGILSTMRNRIKQYIAGNQVTGHTSLEWNAEPDAVSYDVYRAADEGSPFFYIGETTGTTFDDDNLQYDPNKGPISSPDIFSGANNYPGAGVFFEQRLVLARTNEEPTTFWGSRIGEYEDFSVHSPVRDDDSYHFPLDSDQVNEIFWIVPLNELIFGTAGGEWKAGGNGMAITPTNINANPRQQSITGCAPIQPVVVGRSVVFVARSRKVIRDMSYSLEADGFDGDDLTLYAQHLFADRTIVEICFQQEPDSIIWVTTSDGVLLSCTYLPKQRVVSWTRHETQGRFERCANLVNINGTDRVYFTVYREIDGQTRKFIEVMSDALTPRDVIEEAFYVDCGLTYKGPTTTGISGLDHLEGCLVDVLADGNHSQHTVQGGTITLDHAASTVHVGLGYESVMETLDIQPLQTPVKMRPRAIVAAELHLYRTANCVVGPLDREGYEIIRAQGEGWPTLHTGRFSTHPESESNSQSFRLRIKSDAPYPLCVLAVNGLGEYGGQ